MDTIPTGSKIGNRGSWSRAWLWLVPAAVLLFFLVGCADEAAVLAPTAAATAVAAAPSATVVAPTEILEATATATLPPTPTLVPATATPETTTATFAETECPFQPGENHITCGYLTVPENRSVPDNADIQLFVAIVHSSSEAPAEPVIFVHGGPGAQAAGSAPRLTDRFGVLLATRDLIVFDQRGAGLSQPSLDCSEWPALIYPTYGTILTPEEQRVLMEEAHIACRDRLVASGIDLTAYHSAESAADVNALRLALGYEQVNLYGVSYGTRLALTTMRDFPHAVRSAILDSVVPLEVDLYAAIPAHRERSLELLFSHCAADDACGGAFSNLKGGFYTVVDALDAEPAMVYLRSGHTGQFYDVAVDGDMFIDAIFWALYSSETIPHLPRYLSQIARGNVTDWQGPVAIAAFRFDWSSEGAGTAVMCNEELAFSSMTPITETLHPRQQEYVARRQVARVDECAVWQLSGAPGIENEAVHSAIPSLVLAGEFDPITPPHWGKQVAETLDNAYYYEFPSVGHGVLGARGCARAMVVAFIDAPDREPVVDCFAELRDTTFIIR